MSLRDDLKRDEGVRCEPYKCPAGRWTVGCGHNMDAIPLPDDMALRLMHTGSITDEDVTNLLDADIKRSLRDCRALYEGFEDFSVARQDALANFVFNLGMGKAEQFVMTNAAIEREDWDEAARCILDSKWAGQVGERAQRIAKALKEG